MQVKATVSILSYQVGLEAEDGGLSLPWQEVPGPGLHSSVPCGALQGHLPRCLSWSWVSSPGQLPPLPPAAVHWRRISALLLSVPAYLWFDLILFSSIRGQSADICAVLSKMVTWWLKVQLLFWGGEGDDHRVRGCVQSSTGDRQGLKRVT